MMISCVYAWACALMILIPAKLEKKDAILTQKMLNDAKGTFVIKDNYNLLGQKIVIPDGLKLSFSGGSIDNGELCGTDSDIDVKGSRPVFGLDIKISGTWRVKEVHDGWFAFSNSPDFVSNQLINNLLAFSNDFTHCHIILNEDRVYFFELPYKGRADIGELISYRIVDEKKKRNYSEIINDEYAFLRIFTIPSNTHLTINNTLKMLPTGLGAYFVFWEYGKKNVIIDGFGTIAGDNDWHRYDSPFSGKKHFGEWGHIFKCIRCNGFTFKDITLCDSFGDCIMYSGSRYPNEKDSRWASNLTMNNVKILRARRNGVAVGARHVRIENCHFEGCGTKQIKGTSPRCAIDFEADQLKKYPEIGNQDVLMENCSFKDNYFDISSYNNCMKDYGKTATVIRNCKFTSKIRIQAVYWMKFENCYIPFVYNTKDSRSVMLFSRHMEFINCEFGEYDTSIIGKASKVYNKYTNCKFNTKTSHSS